MVDPEIIKQGGLFVWAFLASLAAWTLWRKVEMVEAQRRADQTTCQTCAKSHAEQLLGLGNSLVAGLEHATEAIEAGHRQDEIMKRLDAFEQHARQTRSNR